MVKYILKIKTNQLIHQSQGGVMYCVKCQDSSYTKSMYCTRCGTRLVEEECSREDRIGVNTVDILELMVDIEVPYYLDVFRNIEYNRKIRGTPRGIIWPLALLYRKMYREFFVFFLPLTLISWIPTIGSAAALGVIIYMCIHMNKLYYESICRKIRNNQLEDVTRRTKEAHLLVIKKVGGVTWVSIFVYAIMFAFFKIVVVTLIITMSQGMNKVSVGDNNIKVDSSVKQEEISTPVKLEKIVYTTKDERYRYEVGEDWKEEEADLDFYMENQVDYLAMAGIIYTKEEVVDLQINLEDVLVYQMKDMSTMKKDWSIVDEVYEREINGRKVFTARAKGKDTLPSFFYYYFNLIEYDEDYVMVLQTVNDDDWNTYKDELDEIVASIEPTNK